MPEHPFKPDPYAAARVINAHLERFVGALALPPALRDAVAYALLGRGKRLRPLLAWHACEAMGVPGAASLAAGTSVELIHAFSLVHDDLPALDNDDLRRGKPTLHRHAGEPMAILAGDAMLALAFRSLLASALTPELSHALCRELADGTVGMIEGQVYDTLGGLAGGLAPLDAVRAIHAHKTGALIRAAVRMGAVCGLWGAGPSRRDDPRLASLTAYADAVGLIFQIADDLLDVEQPASAAGKKTGKDRALGKTTYPGGLGVEGSKRQIETLLGDAEAALGGFGAPAEPLRRLARRIAHRRS